MLRLSVAECADALGARLVVPGRGEPDDRTPDGGGAGLDGDAGLEDDVLAAEGVELAGVGIDTRTLEPGALYVAIRGERFDGHDFVARAAEAGARAALVERAVETDLPQLVVGDTRLALGALARHWTARLHVPLIAITGSNGKTTVKELIAAILEELGPVLATRGNLNNELGVPLTLCRLGPEHRYAVIEMGASAAGEIARLAAIAPPDVAVVTNVGPAHLEGFGSLEGVARAKSELYEALGPDGCAVVNADDAFVATFREAAGSRRRREFGLAAGAHVRAVADAAGEAPGDAGSREPAPFVVETLGERVTVPFALAGAHNRANALAAIAAAQSLDVQMATVVTALGRVEAVPGRLRTVPSRSGATLIDDSYNANPASARAALDVLAARGGHRHLVLGDMAELGDEAEALHAALAEDAHAAGIDGLWTLGPLAGAAGRTWHRLAGGKLTAGRGGAARDARGAHFADADALVAALEPHLDAGCTVLVKGSRGSRMERVVDALAASAEAASASAPVPPEGARESASAASASPASASVVPAGVDAGEPASTASPEARP